MFEVIILPIATDTITSIVHTLELLGRLKPVKSFKILYSNVQRVKCHLSSSSFLLHVKKKKKGVGGLCDKYILGFRFDGDR